MNCQYLKREGKPKLAFRYTPPQGEDSVLPVVCFLGGYKSDMEGTKATFFEQACIKRGQGYLRLDYSGHGCSEGRFIDGTIGVWAQDVRDIIEYLDLSNILLVGSSMGGWISLLLVQELGSRVKGVVGIAAAPDFTVELWEDKLTPAQRETIENQGYIEIPNDYSDEPYIFTKALIEDARDNLVLDGTRKINVPVSLVQGMEDADVRWEITADIQRAFEGCEIDVVLIEDGDHRLSRPEDLDIIDREIVSLSHFQDE